MLHDVFSQCFDKLEPGGRIAVNVANLGRKPYRSLVPRRHRPARGPRLSPAGGDRSGRRATPPADPAPGAPTSDRATRCCATCPSGSSWPPRDGSTAPSPRTSVRRPGSPSEGTITMDEFVDATIDVWDIPTESATRVGHPAPFPVELPRRLIELYTYRGDLVLDPFMGSGSHRRGRRADRAPLRRLRHRRDLRGPGRAPRRRRAGGRPHRAPVDERAGGSRWPRADRLTPTRTPTPRARRRPRAEGPRAGPPGAE